MKTAFLGGIAGVVLGVAVATMIYGYQAKEEERQKVINQLTLKGMSAEEAADTFNRDYRVEVNYGSVNHFPWMIGGALFGGAGGFIVGGVIQVIRDSRAKKPAAEKQQKANTQADEG